MTPDEDVCQLTITAPDRRWLVAFGRTLVEDRLCASVHTHDVETSYRWQGRVFDQVEAKATLHTRLIIVPRIVERVRAVHPYDVPHVLVVPIIDGNQDYIQWIRDQTTIT